MVISEGQQPFNITEPIVQGFKTVNLEVRIITFTLGLDCELFLYDCSSVMLQRCRGLDNGYCCMMDGMCAAHCSAADTQILY